MQIIYLLKMEKGVSSFFLNRERKKIGKYMQHTKIAVS